MRSPTSPAMQSVYVLRSPQLVLLRSGFFTHFRSGCSFQGLNNESRIKSGRAAPEEAVAFLFQQKEDPGAACSRSSQVSGIVSSALAVELFGYRYNAADRVLTTSARKPPLRSARFEAEIGAFAVLTTPFRPVDSLRCCS
jgi:hypothetical protein